MKLSGLSVPLLGLAALCSGCAHTQTQASAAPADSNPLIVCKDGTKFTENNECGAHGGIDRQASDAAALARREARRSGAAAAGNAGEVWATPATKTYYCRGDREYGNAKEGMYMSEADAKAKGWHAADAKTCGAG